MPGNVQLDWPGPQMLSVSAAECWMKVLIQAQIISHTPSFSRVSKMASFEHRSGWRREAAPVGQSYLAVARPSLFIKIRFPREHDFSCDFQSSVSPYFVYSRLCISMRDLQNIHSASISFVFTVEGERRWGGANNDKACQGHR